MLPTYLQIKRNKFGHVVNISIVQMLQVANITNTDIFILDIGWYQSDTDIWQMSVLYTKT